MKIFLASDHEGFELKEKVQKFLLDKEYEVIDCGPDVYEPLDDYPDFVSRAALEVSKDTTARAIIFGKTGQGEAMVANRFPRVRAVVYYGGEEKIITLSRAHNDANILSLGADFISEKNEVAV